MFRVSGVCLVLVGLSGCMSADSGGGHGGHSPGNFGHGHPPPSIPGVQGAWGQPVAVASPYNSAPPVNAYQARAMMSRSVPLDMVQMNRGGMPGNPMTPPTIIPTGGVLSPPGVPFAPGVPAGTPNSGMSPGAAAAMNIIKANHPGTPGAGVMTAAAAMPPGAGPQAGHGFPAQRTQVRFVRPSGMKVSWVTQGPDGRPSVTSTPLEVPGRYNFVQAAIYRLKLSNIEGRPGLEIYPTLEVVPASPKTAAFLAHSSVPVEFTNEDFKQIAEGNYVVKVIYLPDPQFQDVAGTGTDEILSTRLEPGADPIMEAMRRGSILLVIRMGNMDQEAPNTPAINAPGPHAGPAFLPPQGAMAMPGPGMQAPGMPGMPPFGMTPGGPAMPPGAMVPPPGMFGPGGPTVGVPPPGVISGPPQGAINGPSAGAISMPPQVSPPAPVQDWKTPEMPPSVIPIAPPPQKVSPPLPGSAAPPVPTISSTPPAKTLATTPAKLPAPEAAKTTTPRSLAPTGLNLPDVPALPSVSPPVPAAPAIPLLPNED